jgi:hypothetical protein
MPRYTLFNPPAPASPGSKGSRSSTLKDMFPNTLKVFGGKDGVLEGVTVGSEAGQGTGANDIYTYARAVFTPENVKGDDQMWVYSNPALYGSTPNGYVSRTYSAAPDTQNISAADGAGPYIPNISSAPDANPALKPAPPQPTPDYNTISAVDKTKYSSTNGVFSPQKSSQKTRITLGQTLKYGISKNSDT